MSEQSWGMTNVEQQAAPSWRINTPTIGKQLIPIYNDLDLMLLLQLPKDILVFKNNYLFLYKSLIKTKLIYCW